MLIHSPQTKPNMPNVHKSVGIQNSMSRHNTQGHKTADTNSPASVMSSAKTITSLQGAGRILYSGTGNSASNCRGGSRLGMEFSRISSPLSSIDSCSRLQFDTTIKWCKDLNTKEVTK